MEDEKEESGILAEDVSNVIQQWFKGMRKVWKAESDFMKSVTGDNNASKKDQEVR